MLSAADFRQRHHVILWLLWLHAAGLAVFALITGNTLLHSLIRGRRYRAVGDCG